MASDVSDEFDSNLEKQVDLLNNKDRNVRRKALESVLKLYQISHQSGNISTGTVTIWKQVLSCTFDSVERCRELAVTILQYFVDNFQSLHDLAVYLIPAVVQRLSNNIEPSEEIRLTLVVLLKCVIEKSPASMESYLRNVTQAVANAIADSYPEVKKEGCACVVKLADTVPEQFHSIGDTLIQPLIQSLVHQHSRVRVASITALGCVVMYGGSEYLVSVFNPFGQRLLDPVPLVRLTVTHVVGDWLQNFPDRYSNLPRLITLLLTSIADEIPEISTVANELWTAFGHQYEQENESDLKDLLNFEKPVDADFPSNVPRFPIGCRIIVTRNLTHLLPAVFNDLRDWQEPVRLKAAQLLRLLLLNAEQGMIQHFPKIIDGLIAGCKDDVSEIVHEVMKSAEVVGFFVPSHLWCPNILEKLDEGASVEKLRILAGLLRRSRTLDIETNVRAIATAVLDAIIQRGHNVEIHKMTLACVESLLRRGVCKVAAFEVYHALIALWALEDEEEAYPDVLNLLDELGQLVGVKTEKELCAMFAKDLIKLLKADTYDMWTSQSTEWKIFTVLMQRTGSELVDVLNEVLPILTEVTKTEKEHTLKFRCFQVLSHLFESSHGSFRFSEDFTVSLIRDCVLPNLAWHPGKTAAVLRSATLSCLRVIVEASHLPEDKFVAVFEHLITRLSSSLRDEIHITRLVACQILDLIFSQYWRLFRDPHQLYSLNKELLQRMEDVNSAVRVRACFAISSCIIACKLSESFDKKELNMHFGSMVRPLLIYLDDPEVEIREASLGALKILCEYDPRVAMSEVEQVQKKFQNQDQLSELLRCIESLDMH